MIYLVVFLTAVLLFNCYLKRRAVRRGVLLGAPIPPWRDRLKARVRYVAACCVLALSVVPVLFLIGEIGAKT